MLILNKTDLVSASSADATAALLSRLNPGASLVRAVCGAVPLSALLRTGRASLEAAARAPGWLRELRGSHAPESAEFGISSFIFRAARPFHPARLRAALGAGALARVVRSKGFAWLAVDGGMDEAALWSSAGRVWQLSQGRPWWAAAAGARAAAPPAVAAAHWSDRFGDRRSEVVVIGVRLDEAAARAALDAACVNDDEWAAGPDAWDLYDDPFDFFPYEEEDESDGGSDGGGGGGGGHSHGGAGHVHDEGCAPVRPTTCRIIVG